MWRFRKYSKKLSDLYNESEAVETQYSELTKDAGCPDCHFYGIGENSCYEDKFKLCQECSSSKEILKICRELDRIEKETDSFIETEYAKCVFDFYCRKKPILIRMSTGEEKTWDQAFGECFEKIDRGLRHSLVGLVEGGGRYIIKGDKL